MITQDWVQIVLVCSAFSFIAGYCVCSRDVKKIIKDIKKGGAE